MNVHRQLAALLEVASDATTSRQLSAVMDSEQLHVTWVQELPEDLDVCIAQRDFEGAVDLVQKSIYFINLGRKFSIFVFLILSLYMTTFYVEYGF